MMKLNKTIRIIGALLVPAVVFAAGPALSHTGGFTYETSVNNYFVDIGASKTELLANELILFEYNLFPNGDPNNLADFDSVYVTVGDEDAVLVSTFVHRPQDMLTVLSFSFPKAGKYEMSARFQKGTTKLAEVSFPLEVGDGAGANNENATKIAIFAAIVIIAGIAAYQIRRKTYVSASSVDK